MDAIQQSNSSWIVIEPPRPNLASEGDHNTGKGHSFPASRLPVISGDRGTSGNSPADQPPSFRDSQFDIILRRQRMRPPEGGGLKVTDLPSRFLNLSDHFEFAGWGSVTHLKIEQEDRSRGEEMLDNIGHEKLMGQFVASALAGNDILGGVFYTLPAVMAVSSV